MCASAAKRSFVLRVRRSRRRRASRHSLWKRVRRKHAVDRDRVPIRPRNRPVVVARTTNTRTEPTATARSVSDGSSDGPTSARVYPSPCTRPSGGDPAFRKRGTRRQDARVGSTTPATGVVFFALVVRERCSPEQLKWRKPRSSPTRKLESPNVYVDSRVSWPRPAQNVDCVFRLLVTNGSPCFASSSRLIFDWYLFHSAYYGFETFAKLYLRLNVKTFFLTSETHRATVYGIHV